MGRAGFCRLDGVKFLHQPGAFDIREWLKMNNPTTPAEASVAQYYRQYWRPFNLLNTGNGVQPVAPTGRMPGRRGH